MEAIKFYIAAFEDKIFCKLVSTPATRSHNPQDYNKNDLIIAAFS